MIKLSSSTWHQQDPTVKDEQRTAGGAVREALVTYLRREWPNSVDVDAHVAAPGASAENFLEACTSLQYEGLIMYEALLLGVGSSPKLLAAALTRKGQSVALQKLSMR
ncbi:hypothetical protein [Croceibacterium ferulae]|uniref:hypothetical protein n=1 Tax=Croceibacterium ferulae TaxID=1854641 RepID=UPI000EADB329|nr:hypothetical protein [Croceibacterium ferulae]